MAKGTNMSRSQLKSRKDFLAALERAVEHEPTRVVLRWLIETTGVMKGTWTGNSETFRNEGRREVGLELMAALGEIDPYHPVRLMKEAADDIVTLKNEETRGEA